MKSTLNVIILLATALYSVRLAGIAKDTVNTNVILPLWEIVAGSVVALIEIKLYGFSIPSTSIFDIVYEIDASSIPSKLVFSFQVTIIVTSTELLGVNVPLEVEDPIVIEIVSVSPSPISTVPSPVPLPALTNAAQ